MAKVPKSRLLRILNSSNRSVFKSILKECTKPLFSNVKVQIDYECDTCTSTTTTTTTLN